MVSKSPNLDRTPIRSLVRFLAVAVFMVLGMSLFASGVSAQTDDDPYGPTTTTTTTSPDDPRTCHVDRDQGRVGDGANVRLHSVPHGATVRILIGGQEAGRATAPAGFQPGTVTLNIRITVPDLEPGEHEVVAVGPDFTVRCLSGPGNSPTFEVLGAGAEVRDTETERDADDADDSGFDVLALTGTNLLLLIALALVLLLVGRRFVMSSRRRRRVKTTP